MYPASLGCWGIRHLEGVGVSGIFRVLGYPASLGCWGIRHLEGGVSGIFRVLGYPAS